MDAHSQTVLETNATFYQALARGDYATMDALWARHHPVVCVHPGWPPLVGRREVMASWRALLGGAGAGTVRIQPIHTCLFGSSALVVTIQEMGTVRLVGTNVFAREAGDWRLCHHQAAPAPSPCRGPAPGALRVG